MWRDLQYPDWINRGQINLAHARLDDGDIFEKLKKEAGGQ